MAHLLSEFEAELGSLAEEVPKPNARVPTKTSSKASSSPGKDTVGRKKVDNDVERSPKERPSSSSSSKRSSSKRVSSAPPGSLGKGGRESGGRKRRRKEKEVLGDPKKGNRERTTRSGTRRRSSSSNKEKDEDRRAAGGTASKSSGVARKRQGGGVKEKPSSSRGEKSASETAVAPAVAEDSLAIVPVPEPVLSESQRRSREVLRSVKKASRANTKRQRGTDKPLQQKEKEKPLSAMTLKEIIRQSVEADRTDNRKRPRPSKKQNQGGGQGQSQSEGQGQGQEDTGGDGVGRKGAASAEGRSGGSVGAGPSKTGQKAGSIAPQVEVVDGEIVINRQSLSMKAQVEPLMKPERRVEESGNKLSAFSYSGYLAPEKWTKEDTTKFYTALEQFGTDFGTIQKFFPKRERKQIKSKFRREEKANPEKIEMALNTHRQMSEEVCVENLKKLVQMMQDAEQDNA